MFCDTPQVNQLTVLLIKHNVHHIVVCPGSRNATIVHNLHAAGEELFSIHPVTDERSAAFVALGMALATQTCVAVCVTSGSALLGCIPAVAEAFYRNIPLLVISADRPQYIIGQLDGQTLPQVGALRPYCDTYQVNPPHTEEDHWLNNLHINEALIFATGYSRPVHINVAIEEPMFNFTTALLPDERKVEAVAPVRAQTLLPPHIIALIKQAHLPAIVIGQYEQGDLRKEVANIAENEQMLVLPEIISDVCGNHILEAFDEEKDAQHIPDLIIQIGGNFVHKKFKALLRNSTCQVIRLGNDDNLVDTFFHLTHQVIIRPQLALQQLSQELPKHNAQVITTHRHLTHVWKRMEAKLKAENEGKFTQHTAIRLLHDQLCEHPDLPFTLHLANSSTVRVAGKVFESGTSPIYCNRGTNGIEGSLSTAVGYAMLMWGLSIVIIGDLSFFYDANALWNTHLPSNLRILLLNNGRGSIFDHLPGLSQSPARIDYIAAGHQHYTAQGIAQTYGLDYILATNNDQLSTALPQFLSEEKGPMLLEVKL